MDDDRGVVPGYRWIIIDPDLLGGQPAICGTRLSVSHILACLAEGMTAADIATDYPGFPPKAVTEVLRFAAEHLDRRSPCLLAFEPSEPAGIDELPAAESE